jgi:Spy/CpxP family protein refolding chaperone
VIGRRLFALVLVLGAVAAAGGAYYAADALSRRPAGTDVAANQALCDLLALSEQQQYDLAVIDKQCALRLQPLQQQVTAAREEIFLALREPQPDLARIDAKIDEAARAQAQMQREIVAHLISVNGILTEQQHAALFEALGPRMCLRRLGGQTPGLGGACRAGMNAEGGCVGAGPAATK